MKAVRAQDAQTPLLIYCGARSAERYRDAALDAGANEITASETVLLNALQL